MICGGDFEPPPSCSSLTVAQTLKFALHMKTPSSKGRPEGVSREEYESDYYQLLMQTFGIEHTADTKVGDSAVRGVSGGERKVGSDEGLSVLGRRGLGC
jgi:ATP-binding cassette subfamily G (WHITE) protein 2 (PDR)